MDWGSRWRMTAGIARGKAEAGPSRSVRVPRSNAPRRSAALTRRAGAFATLLLVAASGVVGVVAPTPATASTNQASTLGYGAQTMYAYVQAGESLTVGGTQLGTTTTSPDGSVYDGTGTFGPASADGIWKVDLDGYSTGYDWQVDVVDPISATIDGRVWSQQYLQVQQQAADETFWIVNDTGYLYEMTLGQYNGVNSQIIANALGLADADSCEPTYRSGNTYDIPACGDTYRIFFEEPADDLPDRSVSADGPMYVAPEVLNAEDVQVEDLTFTPTRAGSADGEFTYSINPRFTGGYYFQVDVDGDGSYDGPLDRSERLGADGTGDYSYAFDGLDAEGNPLRDCTQLNARVYLDKLGEVHLLQVDVEERGDGISLVRQNGAGAPDATIYWNDTALTGERANTTPQLSSVGGTDSTGGVHGWEYNLNSWGNDRTVDDWAYLPVGLEVGEISFGGQCLDVQKETSLTADSRPGDVVEYTVTATNTGDVDYTAENPAVLMDDLSGVLDDATYNGDVAVDREGETGYAESLLSWQGALPAGETVTMTYTVTLQGGGDGLIENVAWQPGGDTNETPVCDPRTAEGRDPVTDEACGKTSGEMPSLSIEKAADVTELPEDGGSVTYTVTVTNTGPGDYSADAPATMTDDLSQVLDDGRFGSIVLPSSGATFDSAVQTLTWSGPLAAGESQTIVYTVTYDASSGDHVLLNSACVPQAQAAPGEDPCAEARVPGKGLEVKKSADPETGSSVDSGQELTYTLTFENVGEIPAPVDSTDDLSKVLDDATLVDGSLAASNKALEPVLDGTTLRVTGEVPVGETYTVTYTVRVLPFAEQGDHELMNAVTGDCDTDCTTQHLTRDFTVEKSIREEGEVEAGDVVTYDITLTNNGEADYTVDRPAGMTDDLSDVLDDAIVNGDAVAVASDGSDVPAPVLDGAMLSWSGPIAAGEKVTVTYSVTVTNRGDHVMENVAVPVCADGVDCAPPTPPVIVELPHVVPSKSSDPATNDVVTAGQVITYVLSWTNDGESAGRVDSTDDLSAVLDDAELTGKPLVDADHAGDIETVFSESAQTVRTTGPIEVGETVTVTYQVTVLPDRERGDSLIDNVLTQDAPPHLCDEGDDSCEPPTTHHDVPKIADHKSVDPANNTSVQEGQVLTYTLTFTNEGTGAGDVHREDDLSGVLDDAELTSQPVASSDALSVQAVSDDRFAIDGTLQPGETVTVTYALTVNEAASLGDKQISNYLVDPDGTPDCGASPEDCTTNPVSDVVVTKTADPESGEIVVEGQVVTYTLTFENTGEGDAPIAYTDHMSGVLDDAEIVDQPSANGGALTVSSITDGAFTVDGTLEGNQTVIVTYSVQVNEYEQQGDHVLGNVVAIAGSVPGPCESGSTLCTEHPTGSAQVSVEKSSDPASGSSVEAGQVITYTLTFVNDGTDRGDVDYTDDLLAVLDDASLTGQPIVSDEALSAAVEEGSIRVTGELAAGAQATVSYQVTVKGDAERGDNRLTNLVAPSDIQNPDCDTEGADCTEHFSGDLIASKSVDPRSGTVVDAGQQLTYTLSFANLGEAPAAVDYTDVLSDVLDDALLVGLPVADDGLSVAQDGDTLVVTGEVAAGATSRVVYTVEVREYDAQGNHHLGNFLTPTGEEPPTECLAGSTLCTQNDTTTPEPGPKPGPTSEPEPGPGAPNGLTPTGMAIGGLAAGVSLLLAGIGGVVLLASRRRKAEELD